MLFVVATLTFVFSNFLLDGSLNQKENLSGELKSPPDSLSLWRIGEQAPFKYRLLHRGLVKSTYEVLSNGSQNNDLFFLIYRHMSFLFQLAAVLSVYLLCWKMGFTKEALTAGVVFCLLPPVLLAYNLPVHTREDMLAYAILALGLLAIEFNQIGGLMIASILGVACRETLLIIPLVNLLHNSRQSIWVRLAIIAISGVEFLGLRMGLRVETSAYNPWEGLQWNLSNLDQVALFGFLTFGVLWLPSVLKPLSTTKTVLQAFQKTGNIIEKSWGTALTIILLTTFAGGIFNEIRLLYLYFPWAIVIAIKWYEENKLKLSAYWRGNMFIWTASTCCVTLTFGFIYTLPIAQEIANASKYQVPYLAWMTVGFLQVFIAVIHLPFFWQTKAFTKQPR